MATLLKTMKSGYTVSYAFFLVGLVMQIILSSNVLYLTLNLTTLPDWAVMVKRVFQLYPGFNFAKILIDISNKSSNHFDVQSLVWVTGPGYSWTDFFL